MRNDRHVIQLKSPLASASSAQRADAEPVDPLRTLSAHRRLIALVVAVCALALALAYSLRAEAYTSSTRLLFRSVDQTQVITGLAAGGGSQDTDRALNTEADVLLGDAVVKPTAEALNLTPAEVRRSTTVETTEDSNVLFVTGTAPSADGAQRLVQVLADSYVERSRSQGVSALESQAEALSTPIRSITARLAALPPVVDDAPQDPLRSALVSQLTTLTQQQEQLRAAAGIYKGQVTVLEAPERPSAPSTPGLLAGAAQGAGLGLVLGVLLALAAGARGRERRSAATESSEVDAGSVP